MKNLLRNAILVLGMLIVTFGCQKENLQEELETTTSHVETNSLFRTGKISDFKDLHQFVGRFDNNADPLALRTSIEDNNDFIILESADIFVHSGDSLSTYTLPILKDSQPLGTFSNLIVQFSITEPTKAFIITYTPDEDYLAERAFNPRTPYYGLASYEPLDYDGSLDVMNARRECGYINMTYCNWSEGNVAGSTHIAGGECTESFMWTESFLVCYNVEEGGTGQGNSIDPPTGPSGGGGDNGDPNPYGGNSTNPTNPFYLMRQDIKLALSLSDFDAQDSMMIDWIEDPVNVFEVMEIHNYLQNHELTNGVYEVEALEFVELAIEALEEGDCAYLPNVNNLTEILEDFDPVLFGDYIDSNDQLDHEAIKTEYQQKLASEGNLAAVNYLIDTYSMETFGSNNIGSEYNILFSSENAQEGDAFTICSYNGNTGNLNSCNITFEIDLLLSSDFGYLTRAIKHELYHVLQAQTYGPTSVSSAAREFDAYYFSIFGFRDLPIVNENAKIIQLVKWLDENWDNMSFSEKQESQSQYNKVAEKFPKICND